MDIPNEQAPPPASELRAIGSILRTAFPLKPAENVPLPSDPEQRDNA